MPIKTKLSDKTLTISVTEKFDHSNAEEFIEVFKGNEGDSIPDKYIIKLDDNIKALDGSAFEALNACHQYHNDAEISIECTEAIKHSIVDVQNINWATVTTTDQPKTIFFKTLKSQP